MVREAKQAIWLNPADIKEQYRNASILKNNRTVFNIAGNKIDWLLRLTTLYRLFLSNLLGLIKITIL